MCIQRASVKFAFSLPKDWRMIKKEDFFIEENKVLYVSDEDYAQMRKYIQLLEAVSRTTYKSIYVIDFFRKNFLYVSKNSLFLCGMPVEKVTSMGFDFYLQQVTDADLPLLLEINQKGFTFAESLLPADRMEYTLGCDIHMKQPWGNAMLIHHEITPLHLTREGKIWLVLCIESLSSRTKSGNIEITRQGYHSHWQYHMESKKWIQSAEIALNDYEKEILLLSAQGFTMKEISKQIHKSIDTIKGYKRALFEKLKVSNITEAIGLAIQQKLI